MSTKAKKTLANERVLFDEAEVKKALESLAARITESYLAERGSFGVREPRLALVGIRTGGMHLAHRLQKLIAARLGQPVPVGSVDIGFYRDDIPQGEGPSWKNNTDVPFEVWNYYSVVVDDVLFTGRTVRAAMDALLEVGRPLCLRLAVLVDRGLRELPVQADQLAWTVQTKREERVKVQLTEMGFAKDSVVVSAKAD